MYHPLVMDGMETLGGVETNIYKGTQFDVSVHLDESAERTGAQLEEDIHGFGLYPE